MMNRMFNETFQSPDLASLYHRQLVVTLVLEDALVKYEWQEVMTDTPSVKSTGILCLVGVGLGIGTILMYRLYNRFYDCDIRQRCNGIYDKHLTKKRKSEENQNGEVSDGSPGRKRKYSQLERQDLEITSAEDRLHQTNCIMGNQYSGPDEARYSKYTNSLTLGNYPPSFDDGNELRQLNSDHHESYGPLDNGSLHPMHDSGIQYDAEQNLIYRGRYRHKSGESDSQNNLLLDRADSLVSYDSDIHLPSDISLGDSSGPWTPNSPLSPFLKNNSLNGSNGSAKKDSVSSDISEMSTPSSELFETDTGIDTVENLDKVEQELEEIKSEISDISCKVSDLSSKESLLNSMEDGSDDIFISPETFNEENLNKALSVLRKYKVNNLKRVYRSQSVPEHVEKLKLVGRQNHFPYPQDYDWELDMEMVEDFDQSQSAPNIYKDFIGQMSSSASSPDICQRSSCSNCLHDDCQNLVTTNSDTSLHHQLRLCTHGRLCSERERGLGVDNCHINSLKCSICSSCTLDNGRGSSRNSVHTLHSMQSSESTPKHHRDNTIAAYDNTVANTSDHTSEVATSTLDNLSNSPKLTITKSRSDVDA
ncbi:unnamed protein product [Owenia fusiformis]|nr:unnamed protein product [Owenia fusiformis]